jgi:hypothetical protein
MLKDWIEAADTVSASNPDNITNEKTADKTTEISFLKRSAALCIQTPHKTSGKIRK